MKKKIVSLALVASLLALVIVGGTFAYFTDSEAATNTFTVGNVDITLAESNWKTGNSITPGEVYAKNPVVTNVGINSAWIRVDVTFTDYNAIAVTPDPKMTDLTGLLVGLNKTNWEIVDANGTVSGDTITYSFYYDGTLASTNSTEPLFTGVQFPAAWGNAKMEALSQGFEITVTANAIQAEGFGSAADAFAEWGDEIAIEQPLGDKK